jgi:protein-tyrosine phosphatase
MAWFQKKAQPPRSRDLRVEASTRPLVSEAARRLLVETDGEDERPMKVLMVCTANVSRSPLAAALLNRVGENVGVPIESTSAGARQTGLIVDEEAQAAGATYGVHYPDHRPRVLSQQIIDEDGADLIIAMSREHAREVVLIDATAISRTFTLKELVRRADSLGAPAFDLVTLESWVAAIAADRDQRELLGQDTKDDVTDPFGRSANLHREIAAELDTLTRRLGNHLTRVAAE